MTALEKMKNWLMGFPLWNGGTPAVDFLEGIPERCGLYCRGVEELSRKRDVLGNTEVVSRLRFTLCRTTDLSQDNIDQANWLLGLQQWIRHQSATGLAPVFGDAADRERIWAEKGSLQAVPQAGTARYTAEITVEFISLY